MEYSLRILKIAESRAPGPISTFLWDWDKLEYGPHCIWLAQGSGHTVLLNTGLPPDPDDLEILNNACKATHPQNFFPPDRIWPPETVLRGAGVHPDEVDIVLINSMGAYATGNIELFRNAEIYMSRTGWVDFMAPVRTPTVDREVLFTDATLTYLVTEGWERVHLLDEGEVIPGISMFWVGGHHRGSMAVSVQTAGGNVVIADTIFVYENFDPGIPIGAVENIFECRDALARIRKQADLVIPMHDNEVFRRYPDGVIA